MQKGRAGARARPVISMRRHEIGGTRHSCVCSFARGCRRNRRPSSPLWVHTRLLTLATCWRAAPSRRCALFGAAAVAGGLNVTRCVRLIARKRRRDVPFNSCWAPRAGPLRRTHAHPVGRARHNLAAAPAPPAVAAPNHAGSRRKSSRPLQDTVPWAQHNSTDAVHHGDVRSHEEGDEQLRTVPAVQHVVRPELTRAAASHRIPARLATSACPRTYTTPPSVRTPRTINTQRPIANVHEHTTYTATLNAAHLCACKAPPTTAVPGADHKQLAV